MSQWTGKDIVDVESRIVAYADLECATAWAQEAVHIASPANIAALDGMGWGAQQLAIRACVTAVSNAYLCLVVPATQDPGYVLAGGAPSGPRSRASEARSVWRTMVNNARSIMAAGGHPGLNPEPFGPRAALDDQSRPVWIALDANDPRAGFDGLYSGCVTWHADGTATDGCDPYTWRTLAWQDTAIPDDLHMVQILPPAIWTLELFGRIAQSILDRGARKTLFDTKLNVVAKNVAEAERLHINLDALPGAAGTFALDQEGLTAAARERARAQVATIAAAATSIAMAANPIAGVVVGLIGAAATFIAASISSGWDPSLEPHFYVSQLAQGGDVAANQEPTYTVEMPPGARRATYVGLDPGLAVRALNGPIDPVAVLVAAGVDCAGWARLTVSRQTAKLVELGYPAARVTEILGLVRALCAELDAATDKAAQDADPAGYAKAQADREALAAGLRRAAADALAARASAGAVPTWAKALGVLAVGFGVEEFLRRRREAAGE